MKKKNNTLFHTPDFISLIAKEYNNAEIIGWIVDEIKIYGIVTKYKIFSQLYILPFGLYIPELSTDSFNNFIKVIESELTNYDYIIINNSPFSKKSFSEYFDSKLFKFNNNHCYILELDKPLVDIVKSFSDTRQKHIKRIIKKNALNIFQTNEKIYFEKYIELYKDTLARWGESTPAYSFELIESLHKVDNIKLWVAEYEGKMLSGMICFYGENTVFDWLAATIINDEFKKLYPAIAVQYAVIEHAHNQGLSCVNMGACDNLDGVKDFKLSWNVKELTYQTLVYQTKTFKALKKIQHNISKLKGI
ncbi:MAG: GNAT family N-acetyltransferase [Bacteroidia bacterium]|nr:GNAT family N-acetyltransferase [Bacteroidia bacterium]